MQTVDRTLFYDRKDNNEHDASVFLGSGGMADALFEPTFYFPFWNESLFAVPWGNWYASGGKSGEEPPAEVKKQMDLYREITKYSDPAKQVELMKQLLDIAADQFYVHRRQHAGAALFGGQEQHAQCLSAPVRMDLSKPGGKQYRAILSSTPPNRLTLGAAVGSDTEQDGRRY